MRRTDDTASEAELQELFSMEGDEAVADVVPVCDGEWRKEGSRWAFWKNEDD